MERERRKRKSRTMMVDGHPVLVDTLTQSEKEYYQKVLKEVNVTKVKRDKAQHRKPSQPSEAQIKRRKHNGTISFSLADPTNKHTHTHTYRDGSNGD